MHLYDLNNFWTGFIWGIWFCYFAEVGLLAIIMVSIERHKYIRRGKSSTSSISPSSSSQQQDSLPD